MTVTVEADETARPLLAAVLSPQGKKRLKRCTYPGCETIVISRRCAKHPYDTQPRPTNPKYLTAYWRRLRADKLRAEPMCAECLKYGTTTPAQAVDHIDGNPENDAPENLRSLCIACHSRKTVAKDGGFGNRSTSEPRPPIGVDGWPMSEAGGEEKDFPGSR